MGGSAGFGCGSDRGSCGERVESTTEEDRFFVRLKSMTVDGFYTSEIGFRRTSGMCGNQYLVKYEGCTHPEHQGRRG